MYSYRLTPKALRELKKLPQQTQQRIINKLDSIVHSQNPLRGAQKLSRHKLGQYRFRIGNYRAIFDLKNTTITVLTIGHRRHIYK